MFTTLIVYLLLVAVFDQIIKGNFICHSNIFSILLISMIFLGDTYNLFFLSSQTNDKQFILLTIIRFRFHYIYSINFQFKCNCIISTVNFVTLNLPYDFICPTSKITGPGSCSQQARTT